MTVLEVLLLSLVVTACLVGMRLTHNEDDGDW